MLRGIPRCTYCLCRADQQHGLPTSHAAIGAVRCAGSTGCRVRWTVPLALAMPLSPDAVWCPLPWPRHGVERGGGLRRLPRRWPWTRPSCRAHTMGITHGAHTTARTQPHTHALHRPLSCSRARHPRRRDVIADRRADRRHRRPRPGRVCRAVVPTHAGTKQRPSPRSPSRSPPLQRIRLSVGA